MSKLTESEQKQLAEWFATDNASTAFAWLEWKFEGPQWVSTRERMPTEEDGMRSSLASSDDHEVLWVYKQAGVIVSRWDDPPPLAVAWCRIPDYRPASLTTITLDLIQTLKTLEEGLSNEQESGMWDGDYVLDSIIRPAIARAEGRLES